MRRAYWVGLDCGATMTNVCVLDGRREVAAEFEVPTDAEAIALALEGLGLRYSAVAVEAGTGSQHLVGALRAGGLPARCMEARGARVFASLRTNKNDRNDARSLAELISVGLGRDVHIKGASARDHLALLRSRSLQQSKARRSANSVMATLRDHGLKLSQGTMANFEDRVLMQISGMRALEQAVTPQLAAWRADIAAFDAIHEAALAEAHAEPIVHLLTSMPGVGPITALIYRATVDDPYRFRHSRDVAAYLGLNPVQFQSGNTDRMLGISKRGDVRLRSALWEAAHTMLTVVRRENWLRQWALSIKDKRGPSKAKAALARRMAIVLHRMWVDGTPFNPRRPLA